MVSLNLNTASRLGLNLLFILGAVVALYFGASLFIPTIIALLLAAMLWPAVVWLHKRLRFRWNIACMTVIFGLILLNLLITTGFVLAVPKMLQVLPGPNAGATDQRQAIYDALRTRLLTVFPLDQELFPEKAVDSQPFMYIVDTINRFVPEALVRVGYYSLSWLWQWILILFILLFLLVEGRSLTRRVVDIFGPSEDARAKAGRVLSDMAHQVRTYLVWRTLINFGIALMVGLVYRWAGLSQPWTWALLTAVLFYIPYIGPIIGGVLPVIDAFLSQPSPMVSVGILLFYLVVTIIEGYVIVPVVMGRSMELNATTVMLACLFWELVWGTLGLFLAMPIMAAIRSICFHVPGWRPWANLMSLAEEEPEADKTAGPPEVLPKERPADDSADGKAAAPRGEPAAVKRA